MLKAILFLSGLYVSLMVFNLYSAWGGIALATLICYIFFHLLKNKIKNEKDQN